MAEYIISTPTDFGPRIDELLAPQASVPLHARVITLSGDLGAGKTTFTQELAKKLGVVDVVTSPTFVIMRIYATTHHLFTRLVHIDAYRIESIREIEVLHILELFDDPKTIVCIEWPEKIKDVIPSHAVALTLTELTNNERVLTYEI